MSALNGSPYSYGAGDMAYYGNFASYGGCGMMWRPYFASAGWEPYANGAWAWYEGAGYSWVSPYPWGWMPYHYGAWSFCPGTGWGWMPGGSWMGLNNIAAATGPNQPVHGPILPVRPPRSGEPTLMAVNVKPLVRSEATPDSFLFRKDSAGLGIPRDELGKLDKFSQHANVKGTARTAIYFEAPSVAGANGRPANASLAATSIHRGPGPSSEASFSHENNRNGFSGPSNGSNRTASVESRPSSSPSTGSSSGHH